jgi:beta-galactosidase
MMKTKNGSDILILLVVMLSMASCSYPEKDVRMTESFNENWSFSLTDDEAAATIGFNDSTWRKLNLPHDWSIEGSFSEKNPATPGGGALPGGIGWYRKAFLLPESDSVKNIFIDFDGVYRNSKVYINNHLLGVRPSGYISFRYDLTPFLNFGKTKNVIAVRVDNSEQPNSRWYSGSGIYRNVWLVKTGKIFIDHWGTYITTPKIENDSAQVVILSKVRNTSSLEAELKINTSLCNATGKVVASTKSELSLPGNSSKEVQQLIPVTSPELWSVETPYLYKAVTTILLKGKTLDRYETPFGIRSFYFDSKEGFFLNGNRVKIKGVCNHHDLGCLGAAVNERALERQLEILKEMGCNGIRTSHNPPAPELLDLCDRMGFIVMDEAFDMWEKKKSPYDYALYWNEWHERDLRDQILRDRNHPSVFIWSIGNEILEQWDTSGLRVTPPLAKIVKELDTTRPVTAACNPPSPWNNVAISGALDLQGYNYAHKEYEKFPEVFPGQKFIATETTSGLMTRGYYDMPSDSIRRWPIRWDIPFSTGNPDNTVSAYDNVSAPWGSTHEETWKIIKKHNFLSGMFIWTGFDYLGEPTPYSWPSRSSYFGIIDLAGFPKDVYYLYQSEWTDKPVLHIFPHWNWKDNQLVDVIAYTSCQEVELFLNDSSLGTKKKGPEDLHLIWRLNFKPGTLKAIGRSNGQAEMEAIVRTAGQPAKLQLKSDRSVITADGKDLAFVTVEVLDKDRNLVPYATNMVKFRLDGEAFIAGVDNGDQVSHEPFKADYRKAFYGKCLVVVQSKKSKGEVVLTATSEGLESNAVTIRLE